MTRSRTKLLIACLLSSLVSTSTAATTTSSGTFLDVEYNDSPFIFQVGTMFDPMTGVDEIIEAQIGGYTVVDPYEIRYVVPPETTQPDFVDPSIWLDVPKGDIEVGGSFSLTTDMDSDAGTFRIIPKPGQRVSAVSMQVNGSYSNLTESASLSLTESLTVGAVMDSNAIGLAATTSGSLPSGVSVSFAETTAPIDVSFSVELDGTSSDPDVFSTANFSSITFTVTSVPEPGGLVLTAVAFVFLLAGRRGTKSPRG